MKEFYGVEVKLGDRVVCMVKNYRSLMEATVIKITDKTVLVEYSTNRAKFGLTGEYTRTYRLMSDQFIVVGE